MAYAAHVYNRLKKLILIIVFGCLIFWFPGGVIIMGASCSGTAKIDGWDWLFSIFIPFYGVIVGMLC